MKSSGVSTSTAIIGSSRTGVAFLMPSLNAIDAAILNAFSFESTSCDEPSNSVTLTSTTGKPASTPFGSVSTRPFCTAGMNSRGTEPPLIASTNSKPLPVLVRLHLEPHVAVLAAAARLLDELAFDFRRLADRFAIRHLRRADVGLDAELALHPVDQDLEVQLAHAGDDRLARFFVGAHAERRVFLRQAIERDAHLLLVGLRLRLDGDVDHRLREDHLLERDLLVRRAQRVAGGRFLQADGRRDVARAHFLDVLALVRVHLQDAADPFLACP